MWQFSWGVFWAVLAAAFVISLFLRKRNESHIEQIAHDVEKIRKHFVGVEDDEPSPFSQLPRP